ncbi:MAG: hypothetical protein PWQ54_2450 [Bacteroidales bacterium]|nr:hypothetical protein [Bacteroidales bacterium]
MISIGYHIRQANDPLKPIRISDLARRIQSPDQSFIDFILQLRSVMSLDVKKYRELKTRLPYVVAGNFHPPFRKLENFGSTTVLILDFDHLRQKEIEIEMLKKKIIADDKVLMLFKSPSGDGLKVFYRLAAPFYDPAKYSIFYKLFASKIANELAAHQVVDKVTSDVSRACFVSYDPDVYLNESAKLIQPDTYVDFNQPLEFIEYEQKKTIEQTDSAEKSISNYKESIKTVSNQQDIPQDMWEKIKEQLNPSLVVKKEKRIFVPEQLDLVLEKLHAAIKAAGIEVEDVKNIHYGKQIKVKIQHWWGEINVFYGKKGYSVVKSTKSGCSEKLTALAAMIVNQTLNEQE